MEVVRSIVAGGQNQAVRAVGRLPQLHGDGVDQRLLAHRLHDAGGSKDGQAALHAQHRVEGALRRFLAAGDGDHDREAARITGLRADLSRLLRDHPAGHGVDRRRPDRLIKARLCHPAHARAAVNGDARRWAAAYGRHNRQTAGHVSIVTGVLGHGAFRPVSRHPAEDRLHLDGQSLRRHQREDSGSRTGQQQLCRSRRRQGRAGAGRIAAAQKLLPAADVVFKGHRFHRPPSGRRAGQPGPAAPHFSDSSFQNARSSRSHGGRLP